MSCCIPHLSAIGAVSLKNDSNLDNRMIFKGEIELGDDIEILVDELESIAEERSLSRDERAIMDVVEILEVIGEQGLHEFWHSPVNHDRVINSFDLIGASQMVDLFNGTQWCRSCASDRGLLTEVETNHLSEIEEDLDTELAELPSLLKEFIEDLGD